MIDLDQAQSLLSMARKDLLALEGMKDTDVFADEIFGFHAQQAAEKAMKAWLALLGDEYPFTHDLSNLLDRLTLRGQDVAAHLDLVEYTPFAVQFRYEAQEPDPAEPLDRDVALRRLKLFLKQVERQLDTQRKEQM